jgi:hypothetical protein
MNKTIWWREVCKFLSGAFFVSAGVLLYLGLVNVSVPIGGVMIGPEVHRGRAVVHSVLCVVTFYLGFVRKPGRGPVTG